jgi:hypothetical protein
MKMYEKTKDNVFKIFYQQSDVNKRKTVMRISTSINDPNYRRSTIRSSVKDQNIYRGFNLQNINTRHRMSQGLSVSIARKTSLLRQTRKSFIDFYEEEESSSDEGDIYGDDSSGFDGPIDTAAVGIEFKNKSGSPALYNSSSKE